MKKSLNTVLLAGMLLVPQANADNALFEPLYLNAHLGYATSGVSKSDVQKEANKEGINATIESVDDATTGYGIGIGYAFNSIWAVELGYLDLDQVDVEFSAAQAVNNLDDIHPESGDGVTLSGLYRYALNDQFGVRARLGAFSWDADYRTVAGPGGQTRTENDSGTDVYWGIGADYRLTEALSLTAEWQRFEFDNEDRSYFNAGVEWRFMAH